MRYLIVSDIHSNLAALEAVLAAAGAVDGVWCLGDVVGYGPQPNECAERLRGIGTLRCIAGNHDWGALGRLDLSEFNPDARYAAEWTGRQLTPDNRAWLEALPERIELEGITLVHGSPRHPIWEYVLSVPVARENLPFFASLTCLMGHTHVPVVFVEPTLRPGWLEVAAPEPNAPFAYRSGRALINPGSVGQPRDGDPRACYCLLDDDPGGCRVVYRRVAYDIEETAQAILANPFLDNYLADRLRMGR